MNLEQLCRTVLTNYHRLRDKKKAMLFVRYQFELLAGKRQKLKLGAIVFELREVTYAGIAICQLMEMRYIRQDVSHEDELKIENRLKALEGRNDFKNICAFIIISGLACCFCYTYVAAFLRQEHPWLFSDGEVPAYVLYSGLSGFNLITGNSAVVSLHAANELLFTKIIGSLCEDPLVGR